MTKSEQKKFIKSLCKSIADYSCKKIDENKVPANWNGFEFRHWLALQFDREDYWNTKPSLLSSLHRKRKKDCNNTIIVNNL